MKVIDDDSIRRSTSIKVSDGMIHHRLVLRHSPESVQPWITHEEGLKLLDLETLVHQSFFHGHYFDTEEEAVEDFKKRRAEFRL